MRKLISFILSILLITSLSTSCYKSPGSICRDGSSSGSTGRGTCSWHGGVRHSINTNEISIPKTFGLVVVLAFIGFVFIPENGKKK